LLERISLCWGLGYQMVDDLKDVLDSSAEAGKTVARDALLDRPNIAEAAGIPGAIERLTRFIRLGDKTLALLVQPKPSLRFLADLRSGLEAELIRVTERSCETAMGECA
jgi:geranylgeranyl pyrophosphate synthase